MNIKNNARLLMFFPTIGYFVYCLLSDNLYSGTEILIGGIVMIQLLVLSKLKKKASYPKDSRPKIVRKLRRG